ncbi:MAG: amino acid permease [Candidatus Thorarchaeota archaeon]
MAQPEVFIREKSGFTRTMGFADALIFNMICIGFFTASIFSYQLSPFAFPGANIAITFLLTIVLALPLYLVWSSMSSSMPRTGGDYIYQSRIVSPVVAFAASFSFTIFWQFWYDASFAIQVTIQSIVPPILRAGYLSGDPGLMQLASATGSELSIFLITVVVLGLAALAASPGLPFYVKLQRVLFALTLMGVVVILYLYATATPAIFRSNFNDFMTSYTGTSQDWYQVIIDTAKDNGWTLVEYNWTDTLLAVPITLMCMGYGFWTIFVFSEVKRANDFKLATYQMVGALVIMGLLFASLYAVMINAVGREFYDALFWLYFMGDFVPNNPVFQIPLSNPNYIFLADMLTGNMVLSLALAIGTAAAAFCLVTQIVIVISRMFTAMTFDRLWPAKLGYVGTKWVSPIYANFVIFLVDVVFAWVGVYYPTFIFYSGAAVLGAWLGYVVDSVAAIRFKKKMPEVYEASAVSRYEIAGRSLTEIVGWLNLIFCAFILYVYAAYWEYILGLAEFAIPGVLLVVSVYIGSALYYMFVKWYRMNRQGIDITLAFRQIPPE